MDTITISSKFQVVIPKRIRQLYNLKPGQKLAFIPYKHSLRIVIMPGIEEAFGFLKGIDTDVPREEEERV